ncbi:MAG: twitching motility protein PilT [Planctomycetota bacterium]|jgi:twitching motility protein PilT
MQGGGSSEHPFTNTTQSSKNEQAPRNGPAPLEPISSVPPVSTKPGDSLELSDDLPLAALPSEGKSSAPSSELNFDALSEESTGESDLSKILGTDSEPEATADPQFAATKDPSPAALTLDATVPLATSTVGQPQMIDLPPGLTSTSISPRHQLEAWLAAMVQSRASDLILRAGGKPSCRVDGKIRFLPGRVPGPGALLEVLNGVVGEKRMEAWVESGSVDVAVQLDGLGRFRLNAYKQMGEPAVVLRRISEDPPLLENLGLPTAEMKRIAGRKRGIVLVTGIAGSGKSTTLAALIQYMNLHFERHVVTLEDPVEMMFSEDRCVISQREIGTDCPDFSQGLRHALRQSPDVILIGEMRDAETVSAALDATETGHLVLSTLHTVNAAQTVDRILSFFPAEQHAQVRQRLAENLGAVMSQRLVPRATGKGMIPACELMTSTPHIRELLIEGRTSEMSRVIDTSGEQGLVSFNMSLRNLVESAQVDLEIALSASDRPDELMMALRGFQHGGDKRASGPDGEDSGNSGLRMAGPGE